MFKSIDNFKNVIITHIEQADHVIVENRFERLKVYTEVYNYFQTEKKSQNLSSFFCVLIFVISHHFFNCHIWIDGYFSQLKTEKHSKKKKSMEEEEKEEIFY